MAGDDDVPSLEDWGPLDEDFWEAGSSFLVPPPPPPPSLGSVCSGAPFYCELEGGPMGAHFDRAAFPSLPIIAVCSSVVLVAVLVASFLLWRHKSKVQNLLPCKNDQQGHLGELGAANGVTYEDVLINHHPTRLPQAHLTGSQALMPLEILDVKLGEIGPPQITTLHHTTFYPNRDPGQVIGGKPFNPVYEEVSQAPSGDKSTGKSYESDFEESGKLGGRSLTSDDDFADEEFSVAEYPSREGSGQCSATSSVRGSTGGDLCKDPVSSDEGNGEDCDYMINDLPEMLPGDNSFSYPRKHLHMHTNTSSERPEKMGGNTMQPPHNHQHNIKTYPLPDRTVNVIPPTQRIIDPVKGNKIHSTPLTDCKKHMSSSHVPSASFTPILSSNTKSNLMQMPANAQWPINHGHEEQMNYPTGSSSQENIYSTIDEDELPDYPVHPSLTSLACPQRGSPSSIHNPVVPKSIPVRGDRVIPQLSQRNADDNGSSYGDIMPAFNSASFT